MTDIEYWDPVRRSKGNWMRNGPKGTQPRKDSRTSILWTCVLCKRERTRTPQLRLLLWCVYVWACRIKGRNLLRENISAHYHTSLFPSFPIFAHTHSHSHSFFHSLQRQLATKKTYRFLTHTMHRNERTGYQQRQRNFTIHVKNTEQG